MSLTTYNIHWAEARNTTVVDATGSATKSGGTGGSYDASARAEQRFDVGAGVTLEATIGVLGNGAVGFLPPSDAYTIGAITVAMLEACWEVSGSDLLAKESGTLRYTGTGQAVVGAVVKIDITAAGAVTFYSGGVLRYTSLLSAATVLGWRPWRAVVSLAGAGAQLTPVTIRGESADLFDPDVSGAYEVALFEDPFDAVEFAPAAPTVDVHAPDGMNCDCPEPEPSGGTTARAYVA